MRRILILIFVLVNSTAYAQRQDLKDSLISEICNTIIALNDQPDEVRVDEAFAQHLYPFLDRYPLDQRNEVGMGIYFRLQRNCGEFTAILLRSEPPNEYWEVAAEKPEVKIRKRVCRKFLSHDDYFYHEPHGDTVRVEISDKFWIDRFKDGTYSKLNFEWINDCVFELTFIESNNEIRKNFSKPGDKYRYQLLDEHKGFYNMSAEITGTDQHHLFNLYYFDLN